MSGGVTNENKPTYLGQYLQFKMLGIYSKRQHLNCDTSANTSKSFKVRPQTGIFDKHFFTCGYFPRRGNEVLLQTLAIFHFLPTGSMRSR